VAQALPGVPHQLCQFHFLREAARPIFEADHRAKTVLERHARGRAPDRTGCGGTTDPRAAVVQGYCAACTGQRRTRPCHRLCRSPR
jgi:hypothetical protein